MFLSLADAALQAEHEEDVMLALARSLREHARCDVVMLQWLDASIRAWVVTSGVHAEVRSTETVPESCEIFRIQDWSTVTDGILCADIASDPRIGASVRAEAARVGVKAGFVSPLQREGTRHGQIGFFWNKAPRLNDEDRQYLRSLADYVAWSFVLFRLHKRLEIDPLTGLLNRVGLSRRWEVTARQSRGALLFIDLGGFRFLNETEGHVAGDRFLQRVAHMLGQVREPPAEVMRYGGDEFVLLLPGVGRQATREVCRRIEADFHRLAQSVSSSRLSISIGRAYWPEDGIQLEVLLKQADKRMLQHRKRQAHSGSSAIAGSEGTFTQEAMAIALARAAELYEPEIGVHLKRIRRLTRVLVETAAKAGHPELQQPFKRDAIVRASMLHDVGKIGVPPSLLLKPGKLTPAEFDLVKTHTTLGHDLLTSRSLLSDQLPGSRYFLQVAANIARHHHEKWNGQGYPDGLVGEAIPLEARLVAIADVYDALRSVRPYKRAWSREEAARYLISESGKAFDPVLIEAFKLAERAFDAVCKETTTVWPVSAVADTDADRVAEPGVYASHQIT